MLKHCFSKTLDFFKARSSSIPHLFGLLALWIGSSLHAEPITGTITSTDPEQSRITLDTGEAERAFLVGRGDRQILEKGDRITGEPARQGDDWRLEKIFPAEPEELAVLERLGEQLHRETLRRGFKAFRAVGERVPRFALWDQRGELFLSEKLRGQYVILNFVFTRCTMPQMCTAATIRMRQLDEALDERGWDDVQLVSITLDPAYDTPGIWTAYAEDRGLDTSRHSLLAGPSGTIEALKRQMGVLAEPDEEQVIRHTLSTALIDPTGEIIYRVPGSRWDPGVFLRQIKQDRAEEEG